MSTTSINHRIAIVFTSDGEVWRTLLVSGTDHLEELNQRFPSDDFRLEVYELGNFDDTIRLLDDPDAVVLCDSRVDLGELF